MSVKNSHCVRCCTWCDQMYDVSLSDAPTDKKYCSQECEADHDEENPPKFSQGQQADEYYERERA